MFDQEIPSQLRSKAGGLRSPQKQRASG